MAGHGRALTPPRTGVTATEICCGVTVKVTPLLWRPLTVTTTLPEVAPEGTLTVMLEALQLVAVPAEVPLKVTVLVPCDAPKFAPLMVTEVPVGPDVGLKLEMLAGGGVTVKTTAFLATPPTVTTTFPVVAPAGTGATMLVALQLVGVATVPLNSAITIGAVLILIDVLFGRWSGAPHANSRTP